MCETKEGHIGGKIEKVQSCSTVKGRGIMIQVLAEMLEERDLCIPLVGVMGGSSIQGDQRDTVRA